MPFAPLLIATLVLLAGLSPTARSQDAVLTFPDVNDRALDEETRRVKAYIQRLMTGPQSQFTHILGVNFYGHDRISSHYLSTPRQAKAELPHKLVGWKGAFARLRLPEQLVPEFYNFNWRNPRFLGTIGFRYYDQSRAPYTLSHLFDCHSLKGRDRLAKTLLIGTGNSHGAHALDVFAVHLKKECGKILDLAFFGDGVNQPLWRSKTTLKAKFLKHRCFNFYQTKSPLVQGEQIEGCTNYLVENPNWDETGFKASVRGHQYVGRMAMLWSEKLLSLTNTWLNESL